MQKDAIRREAERIEEDSIHSGKSHLNSADIWNKVHYALGLPATVAAALAAADIADGTYASSLLAAFAAALVAVATFLNPSRKAAEHEVAGNHYLALNKRTRRFREIDLEHLEADDARALLEELSNKRDDLNESSPNPLSPGVSRARKGIDGGEASYRVDGAAPR